MMMNSKQYKQQVKRFKKPPLNKATNALFITSKTIYAFDTSSIQSIECLLRSITHRNEEETIPPSSSSPFVESFETLIVNEFNSREDLYMNQFVVVFNSEEMAVKVKNGLNRENLIQRMIELKTEKEEEDQQQESIDFDALKLKCMINAAFTIPPSASAATSTSPSDESVQEAHVSEVPGLTIIKDFINEQEEQYLLDSITNHVHYDDKLKSRQVKHFGYEFDYNTRRVNPTKPIEPLPEWADDITSKIVTQCGLSRPDQLTINEYLPGQGIKPHIDTHSPFEDGICSLSLKSDVVMNFTNPETEQKKYFLLPRRSLLIMTGESRYLWRHGIYCKKQDVLGNKSMNRSKRVSLTFRKVRQPVSQISDQLSGDIGKVFPPCQCQWPKYCDSQNESSTVFLPYKTDVKPSVLENEFVVKFYDAVAVHWDHTRHSPWPAVSKFIFDQPQHSLFADVGCGNGKYIKVIQEHNCYYIASDRSEKLAELCSDKYGYDVSVADATILPYRSDQFDAVICIAVMHHISSYARRLQLLKELARICRPGGQILVVAWALEQGEKERRKFEQQDTMVPWHFQSRFAAEQKGSTNKDDQPNQDDKSDSTQQEETVLQRYCHVYKSGELEELLSHIDSIYIVSSELERGNWNIRIQKKD